MIVCFLLLDSSEAGESEKFYQEVVLDPWIQRTRLSLLHAEIVNVSKTALPKNPGSLAMEEVFRGQILKMVFNYRLIYEL